MGALDSIASSLKQRPGLDLDTKATVKNLAAKIAVLTETSLIARQQALTLTPLKPGQSRLEDIPDDKSEEPIANRIQSGRVIPAGVDTICLGANEGTLFGNDQNSFGINQIHEPYIEASLNGKRSQMYAGDRWSVETASGLCYVSYIRVTQHKGTEFSIGFRCLASS